MSFDFSDYRDFKISEFYHNFKSVTIIGFKNIFFLFSIGDALPYVFSLGSDQSFVLFIYVNFPGNSANVYLAKTNKNNNPLQRSNFPSVE